VVLLHGQNSQNDDDAKAKERGVELLKKSCASNHPQAHLEYAAVLLAGPEETKTNDRKTAVESLVNAVDFQVPLSGYLLGQCFDYGLGVEKNMKDAEYWYLKAAQRDVVKAQLALGKLYANDANLMDNVKAVLWYKKAYYNENDPTSHFGLKKRAAAAICHILRTNDVGDDLNWSYRAHDHHYTAFLISRGPDSESLSSMISGLYRTSIHETNNAKSFYNLARLEDNPTPLLIRAAFLGSSLAAFQLYQLPQSRSKRVHYVRKAAESSTDPCLAAQYELGRCYELGLYRFVKNDELAEEWKNKALAQGFDPEDPQSDEYAY
jgi:TPR repeat protein